jgi:hypothetical protein
VGIVRFALKFQHTYYVFGVFILSLGISTIVMLEKHLPTDQHSGRVGDLPAHGSERA